MILTPFEHALDLARPTTGYVRTPGLHMSGLYGALYEMEEPERFAKGDGPDKVRMELGTSFEELLEPALAGRLIGERPGEFVTQHEVDCPLVGTAVEIVDGVGPPPCYCGAGVIYSPDYLFFEDETYLGEFKCTWMSLREAPTHKKFNKWITQVKLYSYHLGVTKVRLFVFFVMGDYSYKPPNGQPTVRAWTLEFSPEELREEWAYVRAFARQAGLLPAAFAPRGPIAVVNGGEDTCLTKP